MDKIFISIAQGFVKMVEREITLPFIIGFILGKEKKKKEKEKKSFMFT